MLRFLICADARASIGTGHLRRMMTLAKELSKDSDIYLTLQTSALGSEIAETTFEDINIAPCTTESVLATLTDTKFDAVILDNYHWNATTTTPLRAKVPTVMVVDDLADRQHDADILLDQNAHHKASQYEMLVSKNCELLVGADYCLLSEEFRRARSLLRTTKELSSDAPIFLSLGGGDPNNDLTKMLRCILENTPYNITIATGSHIKEALDLRHLAGRNSDRVELVFDSTRVADQMISSQFAVAAGGTMTWERAAVGLPSLCLVIADNQIDSSDWLKERNVHDVFDARNSDWSEKDFIEAVVSFGKDRKRQNEFSANSKSLIAGEGVVHTAQALISVSKLRR